jgi:hypothetical protein
LKVDSTTTDGSFWAVETIGRQVFVGAPRESITGRYTLAAKTAWDCLGADMPVEGRVPVWAIDPCQIGSLLQPIAVYCSFWAGL